jgi:hypothetical protein
VIGTRACSRHPSCPDNSDDRAVFAPNPARAANVEIQRDLRSDELRVKTESANA